MADQIVHFVDPNGRIHKVAKIGQSNGLVEIRFADGRTEKVSDWDVAQTGAAANIIARNRRAPSPTKSKVELPQITRDPK